MIGVFGGTTRDLTIDDAIALPRRCASVWRAAPVSIGEAPVEFGSSGRTVPIMGTTADYLRIRDFKIAAGRTLPEGDPHRGERVCLIGTTVRASVFGDQSPLGATVRIGQWRFRVIGLLEAKGRMMGIDMDDIVLVPVNTGMRMFNRTSLFRILVQARSPLEVNQASDQVKVVLQERHDGEEDFTVITQGAMVDAFDSVLGALTAAVAAIAGISLLVAGIGIMNVMLVSVSERTGEIGLLKAIGARRRAILGLFLAEAATLSLLGAAIGVGLALVVLGGVALWFPDLPPRLQPVWLAAAVFVALAVGTAFGVVPARRAANVEAAQALAGRA
jgi:putative ABC transport system permease protein